MTLGNASGRARLVASIGVGIAVGIASGMFGVGGGALLIVGLVALGFTQHEAHATSLAAIVLTAGAALVPFALAGEVTPLAALALAPTAMAGAVFGASVMRRLPEDRLRVAFVVFLLLVAFRMLLGVETHEGTAPLDGWQYLGLAGLGILTGVLSAIMGVGGGMIMVPALVLLFGFGQHAAEGTSLAVVIPTALMGAWRHTRSGYTSWRTGMILGAAGVIGGLGGASLALGLSELTLQRLFAAFLVVMALRSLRKRKRSAPEPPSSPSG